MRNTHHDDAGPVGDVVGSGGVQRARTGGAYALPPFVDGCGRTVFVLADDGRVSAA